MASSEASELPLSSHPAPEMEAGSLENYFSSYEDVEIHRLMVSDAPRTQAYADAISKNRHLFNGKVVMDVGAGTGILSLFMAAAGAKKVYAIEASGMARLIQKVSVDNNFGDIIHVIHDKVENVKLPDDEKVDVIVSEWMGFYLLHESMLNSVIYARDNFLSDAGTMFPSEARIYACPCSLQSLYEEQITFWDNVYGFNMSAVKGFALKSKTTKPEVWLVSESDLLAEPVCIKSFSLKWVPEDEVKFFTSTTFVGITRSGSYQGLCLWFECDFDGRDYDEDGKEFGSLVTLSTSPFNPSTHWKQTVIVFGYGASQSQPHNLECDEGNDANDLETDTHNSKNTEGSENQTKHEGVQRENKENYENENEQNSAQKVETDASDSNNDENKQKSKEEGKSNVVKSAGGSRDAENDSSEHRSSNPEQRNVTQTFDSVQGDSEHKDSTDEHKNKTQTSNSIQDASEDSKEGETLADFNNFVEEDEVVGWKLVMSQSEENVRHYTMSVEMLDPEEEEHPMPCSCPNPRCLIIAKMLEQEMEHTDSVSEPDDCIDLAR